MQRRTRDTRGRPRWRAAALVAAVVPALLLLAAGCHARDAKRTDAVATQGAARGEAARGPDPILIRVPRAGGTAHAYLYPKLDSAVWSGSATTARDVLGFDAETGTLVLVDAKGEPVRLDLRLGTAAVATRARLAGLRLGSGSDIFGIRPHGEVVRIERETSWKLTPPMPAGAVFPQTDGTVIVAASRRGETRLWRVRPPDPRLRDTAVLAAPLTPETVRAQVGDRVYVATDTALVGVAGRALQATPPIRVGGRVAALVPTPSGDRLYVALARRPEVEIVDRYTDRITHRVTLPSAATALRMDRLGRYVLARPARGDSAWVISVATDRLVGSVATRWRSDLPAVAPDGAIALADGRDVVFVDGETLQSVRTVRGASTDLWYFAFWNGFRPRASAIDQTVTFAGAPDSTPTDSARSDSAAAAAGTPAPASPPPGGSVAPPGPPPAAPGGARPEGAGASPPPAPASSPSAAPAPARPAAAASPAPLQTWTVSFATLLDAPRAKALADSVAVNGEFARVVTAQRAGTIIYRVVLGPFGTRAAAEAAGRDSRRPYWIFAGEP